MYVDSDQRMVQASFPLHPPAQFVSFHVAFAANDSYAHPSPEAGGHQQVFPVGHDKSSRSLLESSARQKQSRKQCDPVGLLVVHWIRSGINPREACRKIHTDRKAVSGGEDHGMEHNSFVARTGLVHMVLIWGTNNAITTGLTPVEIQDREVGSKIVLLSRIIYAAL